MVYAALTFWLLVVVLTAWGVHRLWSGLVKPKVFNMVLLPGALVAQVGHVLGLLVTGATISNTTLIKDDEEGAPEATPNPQPRIPVVGPVIIGMLPILACGTAVTLVESFVGATTSVSLGGWRSWLFLYLLICLTVRIAPFPGYLRGSLGAIIVLGIGAAVVASLTDAADPRVQNGWNVLNLMVATLLFLLLTSLLIRGAVGLVKLLREEQ